MSARGEGEELLALSVRLDPNDCARLSAGEVPDWLRAACEDELAAPDDDEVRFGPDDDELDPRVRFARAADAGEICSRCGCEPVAGPPIQSGLCQACRREIDRGVPE
jgi:hypothetical protein